MFATPDPRQSFPEMEKRLLQFWKEKRIFKHSLKNHDEGKEFVFFDGPPFATGLPHYGHLIPGTMKDMVPRYWTMKGYRVERRWGWDCHGLPVEYEKEKELGIASKKDLESYGIAKFNEACRKTVLKYANDWRAYVERVGRWVDMDNDYKTMEPWYMETIWWVFKELWKKGLVYEGEKIVPFCLRCATALSNFEATQGYVDRQDTAITVKFQVKGLRWTDDRPIYLLAWTTTPWTLPANLALAIGAEMSYVLVLDKEADVYHLFAKDALHKYYKKPKEGEEATYEVVHEYMGTELEDLAYEPLFPYYLDKSGEGAFRVYIADFVSGDDGTGIVHQAPYGEDDHALLTKHEIGIVESVDDNGLFVSEVTDFAGKHIFDANKLIISHIKDRGLLMKKESITHSYPHCWRCDSPLIYKPISTWFVQVTALKDQLLANNKKINWVPGSMKDGRFGKWLENVRDWAISRNRFWGTPLPIWKCEDCDHTKVIGSMEELHTAIPGQMTAMSLMRHGEATHNVNRVFSSKKDGHPLTDKGRQQIMSTLGKFAKAPDVIITSPIQRTRETAQMVKDFFQGVPELVEDERIWELRMGPWEEQCHAEGSIFAQRTAYFELAEIDKSIYWNTPYVEGAESLSDIEKRVLPFYEEILEKYKGKRVLIVSHGATLAVLSSLIKQQYEKDKHTRDIFEKAERRQYYINSTSGKEFDIHKHFVDPLKLHCESCDPSRTQEPTMTRVSEVFDCWFESGAMPYAQNHYPFERPDYTRKHFPADFISEGQDQTRGWFYTLHVLATALTGDDKSGLGLYTPAAKNIVVNGMILAEDGKKMSKRLKNYPDMNLILEKYGADALRFFLMNSPAVAAQELRFSEKGVEEVVKTVLLPLWNSYSFFTTYANLDGWTVDKKQIAPDQLTHSLDKWIMGELMSLIENYESRMQSYDLHGSCGVLVEFVDKLTNWYIRRSRRRFWKSEQDSDKTSAYGVLHEVLSVTCQLLAPVCPFISDEIYKGLNPETLSIHLTRIPEVNKAYQDPILQEKVRLSRLIISLGHSIRAHHKVKVRQPLGTLSVGLPLHITKDLLRSEDEVILEELNVKDIVYVEDAGTLGQMICRPYAKLLGPKLGGRVQEIIKLAKEGHFTIQEDGRVEVGGVLLEQGECELGFESREGQGTESAQGVVVSLDLEITTELKQEGIAREFVRMIQDERKQRAFQVSDRIRVAIHFLHDPLIRTALEAYQSYIAKETLAEEIIFTDEQISDTTKGVEVELEDSHCTLVLYPLS